MRILMAEHTFYRSVFQVGGQHLARALRRRGHQVVYVSPPTNTFQLSRLLGRRRAETAARLANWFNGGERDDEGVVYYSPFALLPFARLPLLDSDWVLRRHVLWTIPGLCAWLSRQRPFDVFLAGDPRFVPLLTRVDATRCFLRVTDDLLAFEHLPRRISGLVETAAQVCDGFIVTAKTLVDRLPAGPVIHPIPNGVDTLHFQTPRPEPPDIAEIPRPRAVYVGALESWFDVGLLVASARKLPAVQFILIGPPRIDLSAVSCLPNVHLLGPRPYAQVPAYLQHAQVGVIPFRCSRLIDGVSPLKLFEYMACGLPVVATEWAELRLMQSPAFLVPENGDFASAIATALNDAPGADALREYAASNSWDARARVLEEIITAELPP